MPVLEIKDIHTGYGQIEVLKGVSLTVNQGEIVTLIGANGAGKTTLLMTVSGFNKLHKGEILFNGTPLKKNLPHQIVELGISQAPEGRKIFPQLTVLENLNMGAYTRKDRKNLNEDYERVFALFPILKERSNQKGGTLSGGEQQMLAIGRALMAKPKLLLLDEPSLGLAPMLVTKIFSVLKELNQQGVTIMLVEQNAKMALKLANRGYVIETGTLTIQGPACELLNDKRVQDAYLGA